jgi:hypothetical protein
VSMGTQTRLTSTLQDPHVQELLLKETSNAKVAAREKAKLSRWRLMGKLRCILGANPRIHA